MAEGVTGGHWELERLPSGCSSEDFEWVVPLEGVCVCVRACARTRARVRALGRVSLSLSVYLSI